MCWRNRTDSDYTERRLLDEEADLPLAILVRIPICGALVHRGLQTEVLAVFRWLDGGVPVDFLELVETLTQFCEGVSDNGAT